MAQRTAVLAGAKGLVGGFCLKKLLDDFAYGQVITVSRRPVAEADPKLAQKK